MRSYYFQLQRLLGRLGQFSLVDFSRVERLVFVCKGNICRSPYAEARARQLGLNALSCGLECPNGDHANAQAIQNALVRGVDLLSHRTTRIADVMLSSSDLVVAMEPLHARLLTPVLAEQGTQLTLAGIWSLPMRPYIHDPFGLDDNSFQACFTLIDSSVSTLREHLRTAQRGASSSSMWDRLTG